MIFIDDLKWAIDVMMHPGTKATKSWDIQSALTAYYKVAIIPMILAVILAYAIGNVFSSSLKSTALLSSFGGTGVGLAVIVIVNYLIAIPIGLLIFAAFIQIVGSVLQVFKGSYATTFSAVVYGILPYLVLSWIPLISSIGEIWDIVVTVIAIKNLQKTTTLMAFVTWIGGIIVIAIIGTIVGVIIGASFLGALASHVALH